MLRGLATVARADARGRILGRGTGADLVGGNGGSRGSAAEAHCGWPSVARSEHLADETRMTGSSGERRSYRRSYRREEELLESV